MYLYLKAFHLIFMICWFAELFYIFRLFVYHVQNREKTEVTKIFEKMEYRLIYFIGHPSMVLTLLSGFWMLAYNPEFLGNSWIVFKLALVGLLIGYQIFCGVTRRRFAEGNFFLSEKTCRLINEIPTVLLIAIVIFAVVKP